MIIKSKLNLALSAMLLLGSASAYAQVQLSGIDGEKTWDAFVSAVKDPSTLVDASLGTAVTTTLATLNGLPTTGSLQETLETKQTEAKTAQDAYDKINKNLTDLNNQLNRMPESQKYESQPISWLNTLITNAKSYEAGWNVYAAAMTDANNKEKTVYYILDTTEGLDGEANSLYLSFATTQPTTKPDQAVGNWTKATDFLALANVLYPINETTKKRVAITLDYAYVYLGAGLTTATGAAVTNTTLALTVPAKPSGIITAAVTALNNLANESGYKESVPTAAYNTIWDQICDIDGGKKSNGTTVAQAEGTLAKAKADLDAANAAVTTAQNAVTAAPGKLADAQKAYDNAKAAYDAAVVTAQTSINNVTLTQNISTSTPLDVKYTGTINGKNNVITVNSTSALFSAGFAGTLENVAINGTFASSTSGATFSHVAVWTGSTGRWYAENTTTPTKNNLSFNEVGFEARDFFGVNLKTSQLEKLAENKSNILYFITVYNPETGKGTDYYAQKDASDNFVYGSAPTTIQLTDNTFIVSKTADLAALDLNNIIYNGTCKNVKITDREAFFCPMDITAESVSYSRNLTLESSVICLPFEIDPNNNKYEGIIRTLGTYDQEAGGKFWFKNTMKTLPANTPALVVLEGGKTLTLTGDGVTSIAATPADMYKTVNSNGNDGSVAYGLLSTFTSDDLVGTQTTVFALSKQGTFNPMASAESVIPSFRTVIYSPAGGKFAPARQIGFFNELGVDITDLVFSSENIEAAVEEIAANANGLTIEGGLGEIIFTSEADFGKVAVFSLDGKVAAMANVVAGTTTVNLANGLYIVNGQKVLVK